MINMIPKIALSLSIATVSSLVLAGDLGPDEAIKLVEQGKIKHFSELNKIAQGLHPNAGIVETELENHYGKYVYSLDMQDANKTEWDVHINAQSGEVLKNQQDDND